MLNGELHFTTLRVKRCTRAEIDAAAAASGLAEGEPYLITDEDVLAVGTGPSTYVEHAKPPPTDGRIYSYQDGAWVDVTDRITAPTAISASIDEAGTTLTITLDKDARNHKGFFVEREGSPVALTLPGTSGPLIVYSIEQVYSGQALQLFYSPGDVTDRFGNALEAFADYVITNNSSVLEADTTPPILVSAAVSASGTTSL